MRITEVWSGERKEKNGVEYCRPFMIMCALRNYECTGSNGITAGEINKRVFDRTS